MTTEHKLLSAARTDQDWDEELGCGGQREGCGRPGCDERGMPTRGEHEPLSAEELALLASRSELRRGFGNRNPLLHKAGIDEQRLIATLRARDDELADRERLLRALEEENVRLRATETQLSELITDIANERDPLELRRIRGEPLSTEDVARLQVLDEILGRMLPERTSLPQKVKDAIIEVHRLARRHQQVEPSVAQCVVAAVPVDEEDERLVDELAARGAVGLRTRALRRGR